MTSLIRVAAFRVCFGKWSNICAGVSPAMPGRHVLEGASPAGGFPAAAPESGRHLIRHPAETQCGILGFQRGAFMGLKSRLWSERHHHRQEVETAWNPAPRWRCTGGGGATCGVGWEEAVGGGTEMSSGVRQATRGQSALPHPWPHLIG